MKNKVCPICKTKKPLEEYHKYFSKERQKYRVANYCKPCSREVSKKNATKNYYENKPKKLEYAKKYRAENKELIKAKRPFYKKKQIEECQNCYVRDLLITRNKIEKGFTYENPEILETKRLNLKIKRKLKNLKMARNKLSDLNDHLFAALERLNDEDLSVEKLEMEEKRVKAISAVSHQIISVSNLVYKAAVSISKGDIEATFLPEGFETKRIADKK